MRAVSEAAGALGARVPSVACLTLSLRSLESLTNDEAALLESGLAAIGVAAVEVKDWLGGAHIVPQHVAAGRLSSLLSRLPSLRGLDAYGISSLHDPWRVRRRWIFRGASPPRCVLLWNCGLS